MPEKAQPDDNLADWEDNDEICDVGIAPVPLGTHPEGRHTDDGCAWCTDQYALRMEWEGGTSTDD